MRLLSAVSAWLCALLLLFPAATCSGQLLVNSTYGFETPAVSRGSYGVSFTNPAGPPTSAAYTPFTFSSLAGIARPAAGTPGGTFENTDRTAVDGQQYGFLQSYYGPSGVATMTTTMLGMALNSSYTLTFWYSLRDPTSNTTASQSVQNLSLSVSVDRQLLFAATFNADVPDFLQVQRSFLFTNASTTLNFTVAAPGGDQSVLIDAVSIVPSSAVHSPSAPVINLSTGLGLNNNVVQLGAVADRHWTVLNASAQTAYPGNADFAGDWVTNDALSTWVTVNALTSHPAACPYTFYNQFSISGFNSSTVVVSGEWTNDNSGTLSLNGNVLQTLPGSSWTSLHPFSVIASQGIFNLGLNTLSVTLDCDDTTDGIRVQATMTGVVLAPSSSSSTSPLRSSSAFSSSLPSSSLSSSTFTSSPLLSSFGLVSSSAPSSSSLPLSTSPCGTPVQYGPFTVSSTSNLAAPMKALWNDPANTYNDITTSVPLLAGGGTLMLSDAVDSSTNAWCWSGSNCNGPQGSTANTLQSVGTPSGGWPGSTATYPIQSLVYRIAAAVANATTSLTEYQEVFTSSTLSRTIVLPQTLLANQHIYLADLDWGAADDSGSVHVNISYTPSPLACALLQAASPSSSSSGAYASSSSSSSMSTSNSVQLSSTSSSISMPVSPSSVLLDSVIVVASPSASASSSGSSSSGGAGSSVASTTSSTLSSSSSSSSSRSFSSSSPPSSSSSSSTPTALLSLSPSTCNYLGYDFSCLSSADFSVIGSGVSGDFSYSINVCGTSHNSVCTAHSPSVSFCQLLGGSFNYAVDINAQLSTVANPAAYTPVWSFINGNASQGVQYTLSDGDLCGSSPREAVVQFVCGSSTQAVSLVESPQCTYTLIVATPLACSNPAIRTSCAPSSLSSSGASLPFISSASSLPPSSFTSSSSLDLSSSSSGSVPAGNSGSVSSPAALAGLQPSSSPLSFGSSSPLSEGAVITANASLSSLNPAPFSGRRLARGVQQSLFSNPYLPSIFLVGGQGNTALTDAIWQSTDGGVSWSPLGSNLTLSAIPTYMGSAVALFVNGVLTIYGGQLANGTATSSVATLNTLSTSLLPLTLYSAPWTPRYNHAYTTLPASNVTVFCAGLSSVASANTSDCWMGTQPELGPSSWTQLTASGLFPSSLSSAAMVSLYDSTSTLLLCGGAVVSTGLGSAINTCWVSLTLGVTWSSAIPAAWAARTELVMTSDLDGWAYLYGGQSTSTGLYFYDLWLSTDKAQHWLPVLLPPGVQLNVQEGCLALYYTQQYVSGAFVTLPQLVLYSGAQPSTGGGGGYVLGDYFALVSVSGLVSTTPPLSHFSLSPPLLASECQFTFNVAGTLTGFGVSSANPNAALVAGYIAALVGAILGVPASAVQVCVHVTYAYPGTLRAELYLYSAAAGLVGVVNNITAATNTTLLSTSTTIPVTAPLTTASSSSGSSTQSAVGGSSSGAVASSSSSLPSPPSASASAASSSVSSSSSSSSTGAAAAYSDPRFVGFWGQSFFVGGRAGGVYNLLNDADVQVNAHFVQLSNVTCPLVDGRAAEHCYVEAGTYFGVLSVMVRGGAYVRITGGGHDEGFHSVRIQDQISIEVGDSWDGVAMGHGEERQGVQGVVEVKGAQRLLRGRKGEAADADSGEQSSTFPTLTVHRSSPRTLRVRAGVYELQVDNMDQYVDVAALDVSCWQCVVEQLRPEGLLGQTWNATAAVKHSEDEVEQYRERDDHLLGCKHQHDRFCGVQHSKQQQQQAKWVS